jgi:hypothetical protein
MRDFEWEGFKTDGPEVEGGNLFETVASLIAKLFEDLQLLVRQELSLARAELREEGARAQRLIGWLFVSLVMGVIAAELLVLAAVFGVQSIFRDAPLWACFAGVGGCFGIVAILINQLASRRRGNLQIIPRRTLETLKENVQWLRHRRP